MTLNLAMLLLERLLTTSLVQRLLSLQYHPFLAAVVVRRKSIGGFICILVSHIEKKYNLFCAISTFIF